MCLNGEVEHRGRAKGGLAYRGDCGQNKTNPSVLDVSNVMV